MSGFEEDSGLRHALRHILACLFLLGIILAVFGPVCRYGFIEFDDPIYVTEVPQVQAGLTGPSVRWAWTTGQAGNWHPLMWLSLQLDYQLYDSKPWGFHRTNLALHCASTVLLFVVLRRMTGAFWRSALAAALFAVHPLNVEPVVWIASRKDVLSTTFGLLAIGAYVWYVEKPSGIRYLVVVLTYAASLLAKPMLVTLPFLLLLLDYFPIGAKDEGRGARGEGRPLATPSALAPRPSPLAPILEKLPLLALAAMASVVAKYTQEKGGALGALDLTLGVRLANAVVSYVTYLGKAIWPVNLIPFYPHPGDSLRFWEVGGAVVLLTGISLLVWRAARRQPYLPVGWFWFLGTLVPVIGLVQVGAHGMADRYTYFPFIGLFLAAVWGLTDLARRGHWLRVLIPLAGVVLVALMLRARSQVDYWRDDFALWQHTLRVNPHHYQGHTLLGAALEKRGKIDEAIAHYRAAQGINPDAPLAYFDRATALAKRERWDEAVHDFQAGLAIDPEVLQPQYNLATILLRQGKWAEAEKHFEVVIRLDPHFAAGHFNLGVALVKQGKLTEAIDHYHAALQIDPGDAMAYFNLGIVHQKLGRQEEARRDFQEALRLKPGWAEAEQHLKKMGEW